jgi:hypothetical protein
MVDRSRIHKKKFGVFASRPDRLGGWEPLTEDS